jgi:hypothetical protein
MTDIEKAGFVPYYEVSILLQLTNIEEDQAFTVFMNPHINRETAEET